MTARDSLLAAHAGSRNLRQRSIVCKASAKSWFIFCATRLKSLSHKRDMITALILLCLHAYTKCKPIIVIIIIIITIIIVIYIFVKYVYIYIHTYVCIYLLIIRIIIILTGSDRIPRMPGVAAQTQM